MTNEQRRILKNWKAEQAAKVEAAERDAYFAQVEAEVATLTNEVPSPLWTNLMSLRNAIETEVKPVLLERWHANFVAFDEKYIGCLGSEQ